MPTRFSDGTWNILYLAGDKTTTYAEVAYHLKNFFYTSPETMKTKSVKQIVFELTVGGKQRDFTCATHLLASLKSKDDSGYSDCQKIAKNAISDGVDYLKVPSARNDKGICFPTFESCKVSSPTKFEEVIFTLSPDSDDVVVQAGSNIYVYNT